MAFVQLSLCKLHIPKINCMALEDLLHHDLTPQNDKWAKAVAIATHFKHTDITASLDDVVGPVVYFCLLLLSLFGFQIQVHRSRGQRLNKVCRGKVGEGGRREGGQQLSFHFIYIPTMPVLCLKNIKINK